ncbi:MAG: hypothetical protein ACE5D8_05515 [Fidelibacterota bacterium]
MSEFRPLLPFLFFAILSADMWQGYVYSDQGQPLEYAYIIHVSSQDFTVTDGDGFFILRGQFLPGDSIRIQRYGYQKRYILLPAKRYFSVTLPAHPIPLAGVEAEAKYEQEMQSSDYVAVLNPLTRSFSQRQIFATLPGVSIRTYGGPGSMALMSIDGGVAPHTKVRFNGLDMNSAQTGITDLSQFPVTFFRSVHLNPDGFRDGTVSIYVWDKNTIQLTGGSYGRRTFSLTHSLPFRHLIFRLGIHHTGDSGDFPVRWRDHSQTRTNNDFTQSALMSQMDFFLSRQWNSRLFYFRSLQQRGNPGQVWSPSDARRSDAVTLASFSLVRFLPSVTNKTILSWKASSDHYTDPAYALVADHRLETFTITGKRLSSARPRWETETRVDVVLDKLQSTGAGNRTVKSGTLEQRATYLGTSPVRLESVLRIEYSDFLPTTTALRLRLTQPLTDRTATGIHLSRSTRNPSLNELFWTPGGNPDLEPETLYKALAFFDIKYGPNQQFRGEIYFKRSVNLIQWTPVTTFWTPINIRRTERLGIKGRYTWQYNDMTGTLVASFNRSRNLSGSDEQGKRLLYAPAFILHHSLTWHVARLNIQWKTDYRSRMISRYDWPHDIWINPMTIHSLIMETGALPWSEAWRLSLRINNVMNQSYEYSKGYPEMGRSIYLTLTRS